MFQKAGQYIWSRAISTSDYWLTRFVLLRLLGFVYLFAFISLATQVIPLIGENGLLPADNFIERVGSSFETEGQAFVRLPTLFWFFLSDGLLLFLSWFGVLLSVVVLIGFANVPILFLLWLIYLSFVNVAQLWLSYGWEMQLLETGFLAMLMVPLLDPRPFPKFPPPVPVIWLMRWLAFRIHIGAGLIKLRGDECWRNLTCLIYHYETQPIPNPLSPWFHFLPSFIHKIGTLFNHGVELIVPFFIFVPWRRVRHAAGILSIGLQLVLVLSGNLSFINWITIVPFLAAFDDSFWSKILPRFIVRRADRAREDAQKKSRKESAHYVPSLIFGVIVALLSIPVVLNLFSSNQRMNTSFNQFHFVNTYGAFGAIGKERYELVIQGTNDEVVTEETQWKEYEFKAKPTDLNRSLPIIAPYQPRIDWQIWFAAMSTPDREPWLIHFVWKLLHNDPLVLKLIGRNPFSDEPPKYIRIEFYKYSFAHPLDKSGAVWKREYIGSWLPPLSRDTPELQQFIRAHNWE